MKYFFLYAFLTINGQIMYVDQPAHINWKPINEYNACVEEAQRIEERMMPYIQDATLFTDLKVTCERYLRENKR